MALRAPVGTCWPMAVNPRLYRPVALLLVLAAYAAVVSAGLVWDDQRLLGANAALEHPDWVLLFRRDLWCCVQGTPPSPYYRPLMALTLLLDHVAWPSAPAAHLQSLAWHLAVTALLGGALARRVGEERAAVACLVFGLHPVQTEAVVWIAARNDLLVTAFVLAAIRATDRDRPALAGACALLACLSKESGFLVYVYVWVWRRSWGERLPVRQAVGLGLGTLIALGLRLSATLGVPNPAMTGPKIGRLAAAAGRDAAWSSWPWPLTGTITVYSAPMDGWTLLAALATCALAALAIRRGAGWAVVLAVAGLVPSVGGIVQYGTIGERYLYLSMVGVAASVAVVFRPTWAARAILAAWSLASLYAIHIRLPDWTDDVTFFGSAARRRPDSFAFARLGQALAARQDWRESLLAFDAALAVEPRIAGPCVSAAEIGGGMLDAASFAERVGAWSQAGCLEVPGYADEAALTLAREGRWGDAARLLNGAADGTGRLALVAGSIREMDGDLLGEAAIAVGDPRGAGAFRAEVAELICTGASAPGSLAPGGPEKAKELP